MNNHPQMVMLVHACFSLGFKIVLLNNKLTKAERRYQLEDAKAAALFTEPVYASDHKGDLPVYTMETLPEAGHDNVKKIESEFDLNETATIMYTSGTTGQPKGSSKRLAIIFIVLFPLHSMWASERMTAGLLHCLFFILAGYPLYLSR